MVDLERTVAKRKHNERAVLLAVKSGDFDVSFPGICCVLPEGVF